MVRHSFLVLSALSLAGCATLPQPMTSAQVPGYGAPAAQRPLSDAAPMTYRPLARTSAERQHGQAASSTKQAKTPVPASADHAAEPPTGGFGPATAPTDLVTHPF